MLKCHGVQVMSVVTVGNEQDILATDTLHGLESKRFMAHYTCPSFAVNEACRCVLALLVPLITTFLIPSETFCAVVHTWSPVAILSEMAMLSIPA